MGLDVGKSAKRMGKDHPRDARKIDQNPVHVAPHKKPRQYRLTLMLETVKTSTLTKEFISKAAMQEFRGRVQRELDKRNTAPPRKYAYYLSEWQDYYELKMDVHEVKRFKAEPTFIEEMIEWTPAKGEGLNRG